jgi:hypothetical protein
MHLVLISAYFPQEWIRIPRLQIATSTIANVRFKCIRYSMPFSLSRRLRSQSIGYQSSHSMKCYLRWCQGIAEQIHSPIPEILSSLYIRSATLPLPEQNQRLNLAPFPFFVSLAPSSPPQSRRFLPVQSSIEACFSSSTISPCTPGCSKSFLGRESSNNTEAIFADRESGTFRAQK